MEPHYPPVASAPLLPAELQLIGLLASMALEQALDDLHAAAEGSLPAPSPRFDTEVPHESGDLHPLQH